MRKQLKSTAATLRPMNSAFQLIEDGVRKKPWRGRLKICLVYPHTYYVGMSNLGFQTIYSLWNDLDEVVCERGFLSEDGKEVRSIESNRPLRDFDVIAFTLSFENDSIHVLRILAQAGIPIRASERDDREPLVIMGGAAVSMNPCPMIPFIDLFAFGDGEDLVYELAMKLRANPFLKHHRARLLESLIELPGVFSPEIQGNFPEKPIPRRTIKFINSYQTKTEIVTNHTEFSGVFLAEVSRGCPQKCRFCSVSYTEASTRFRRLSFLKSAFDEGIARVGRVGLLGAALADHPELVEMSEYVVNGGGEISLSSLRVEAVSSKLMELLVHSRQRTLTLALETGSVRLQNVIHKRTKEENISHVVETALRSGVRNLKFYFIIGLPTEQREDILELAALVKRLHKQFVSISKEKGQIGNLSVSLNPFIPKPTTPFEACAHLQQDELQARFDLLMKELEGLPHLHVNHEGWDTAILQSLLSVGSVETSKFLEDTHRLSDDWRKALKLHPELIADTVYRPKSISERLPWSFVTR
ncbi:MAG: radical SAM protein [Deltaproteobacteria bacterium]|nr:radical SAM protein [Deltaproteobacteria bacterium]